MQRGDDCFSDCCIILCTHQVNYHQDVLHLLLDVGADIDKLNSQGMSALAVCHLLYYPFLCLPAVFTPKPARTQVGFYLRPFCAKEREIDSSSDQALEIRESEVKQEGIDGEERQRLDQESRKEKREVYLKTLKLLLKRGADPNTSRVPVPVLFSAILACDREGIKRLLLLGARTDIPLPPEARDHFFTFHLRSYIFVFVAKGTHPFL